MDALGGLEEVILKAGQALGLPLQCHIDGILDALTYCLAYLGHSIFHLVGQRLRRSGGIFLLQVGVADGIGVNGIGYRLLHCIPVTVDHGQQARKGLVGIFIDGIKFPAALLSDRLNLPQRSCIFLFKLAGHHVHAAHPQLNGLHQLHGGGFDPAHRHAKGDRSPLLRQELLQCRFKRGEAAVLQHLHVALDLGLQCLFGGQAIQIDVAQLALIGLILPGIHAINAFRLLQHVLLDAALDVLQDPIHILLVQQIDAGDHE